MARIAVGSLLTECNQLGGSPIDMDWFARYDLHFDEDLFQIDSGVVGGALSALRAGNARILPLLAASTCPGGYITQSCYDELRGGLLQRLERALPVDGVLLLLHGAAVAAEVDDVEGDLIEAARALVGPAVPIIGTLDLHAHVTRTMVRDADGLLAWETYPHRDAFTTGERGARLLLDTVAGRCQPVMAMVKVPVITSAVHGSTEGDGPFARLMRFAKSCEEESDSILSTSVVLVHPYLDQPGMGSGGLVIADADGDAALALAHAIATRYWESRHDLEPQVYTPGDAIAHGLQVAGGPVLLVETADCAGGGASGDSVATLKALLKLGDAAPASMVPVVDPRAVTACRAAGAGAPATLVLGHQLDRKWGEPLTVTGRVRSIADGHFRYTGGMWDGTEGEMGPCAVFEVGAVQILVTSHATYDWADEQFRAVGLDPAHAKFVVVKNPMNYRIAYGSIAAAVFILDTPGPTPPTLRHCPFERVDRPYYPADEQLLGLVEPVALKGW